MDISSRHQHKIKFVDLISNQQKVLFGLEEVGVNLPQQALVRRNVEEGYVWY